MQSSLVSCGFTADNHKGRRASGIISRLTDEDHTTKFLERKEPRFQQIFSNTAPQVATLLNRTTFISFMVAHSPTET